MLKSKSLASNGYIEIDHDIWRYVTKGKGIASEHKGHFLYQKEDFSRLSILPSDWWYYFNQHGEGRKINFHLKAKAVLHWSSKKHVLNGAKVEEGSRFPIEKISISFARDPCNEQNLFR